jgi:hypothetical protein
VKIIDCEQGSPEWHAERLGKPTASRFSNIVTPTGALSKSSAKYMYELLAGWALGMALDSHKSAFMDRGSGLEVEARADYEFRHDVDVEQVGFVVNDEGTIGCSPDGLVGDEGMVEIKCYEPAHHIEALLGGSSTTYHAQRQGQLWITERKWVDFVVYHPDLPQAEFRIERDEPYIEKLSTAVLNFTFEMEVFRARLMVLGCTPSSERVPAGARCSALRDDGRFCMGVDGLAEVDGAWLCEQHRGVA